MSDEKSPDYIGYGIERVINDLKLETAIYSIEVERIEKEDDKKC